MPLGGIVGGIRKCAAVGSPMKSEPVGFVLVAYDGLNRDKFLRVDLTAIHCDGVNNRRMLQNPSGLAAVDEGQKGHEEEQDLAHGGHTVHL